MDRFALLLAAYALLSTPGLLAAADWPAWRGPDGTGRAAETDLPTEWSQTQGVKWKAPLDGPGNSTPVVVGDKVFLTHSPAKSKLRGMNCCERNTGKLVWQHQVEYAEEEPTHATNPFCSSSPVSDGACVIAWYGSAGLFCYDLAGNIKWQKDLGKVEHIWGYGASPLIHGELVILNYGPGLNAFVVALEKATGREVWRREFPGQKSEKVEEFRGSWSTPVAYRDGQRDLILLSLPNALRALAPKTGDEVWSCGGLGDLVYTSPLISGNVIVSMSGYGGPALAVKAGGAGDVTETHRLWHHVMPKPPQRVGSGVVVEDHIYIHNEPYASCIEVQTGEQRWQQRLEGRSWCSVVSAGGRLYASNEAGTTFVLKPRAEKCEIIAENKLGELMRASPAVSDGQIFLRTYNNLYCIGN
jgi:outer membrane protein assembly factor BamB